MDQFLQSKEAETRNKCQSKIESFNFYSIWSFRILFLCDVDGDALKVQLCEFQIDNASLVGGRGRVILSGCLGGGILEKPGEHLRWWILIRSKQIQFLWIWICVWGFWIVKSPSSAFQNIIFVFRFRTHIWLAFVGISKELFAPHLALPCQINKSGVCPYSYPKHFVPEGCGENF